MAMDSDRNKEKILNLFDSEEVAKTGTIDRETLVKAFQKSNHPLYKSKDHIDQLFKNIDNKHDNCIDYSELTDYFSRAENEIKKAFVDLDKQQQGYLTREELKDYLENKLKLSPSPNDFNEFYNNVDSNHDGRVTYDEWRDLLLLVPRNQGSRLRTVYRYFNEDVDLSSDGDMTVIDNFLKGFGYFVSGGVAGVISRTCTAPFDRMKVFLIARADLSSTFLTKKDEISKRSKAHPPPEKIRSPLVKAAQSLYREGGLKSFYVGNGLNCLKVFPEAAMKFGSFEIGKRMFMQFEGKSSTSNLSRFSNYLAGGFAGMVSQFTVYPVDTLKYRVQCAPLKADRRGIILRTAKEMYKEGGIKLFYRGIFVGVTGIFPYAAIDLGTFTSIKQVLIKREALRTGSREENVKLSNLTVLPLGAFSGTVGACVVYPINLLRTRLQAQGTFAHPFVYTGIRDVFSQTVEREGYRGLYKGLSPNLAKVIPAVSITYLVFENMKRVLELE